MSRSASPRSCTVSRSTERSAADGSSSLDRPFRHLEKIATTSGSATDVPTAVARTHAVERAKSHERRDSPSGGRHFADRMRRRSGARGQHVDSLAGLLHHPAPDEVRSARSRRSRRAGRRVRRSGARDRVHARLGAAGARGVHARSRSRGACRAGAALRSGAGDRRARGAGKSAQRRRLLCPLLQQGRARSHRRRKRGRVDRSRRPHGGSRPQHRARAEQCEGPRVEGDHADPPAPPVRRRRRGGRGNAPSRARARPERGELSAGPRRALRRARRARRGDGPRQAGARDRHRRAEARPDRRSPRRARQARQRLRTRGARVASPLSPATRDAALAAMAVADLDVLVVGGGITGAGIARDAALRGLAVALVDAVDFAAGTSSRSSKLIHGGVRYLAQGDVGLVREAASERLTLKRIAPHLATAVTMLIPTYARSTHVKLAAGLWTFEKLAPVEPDDRHRMLDRAEALAREPALAGERLFGAAAYGEYLTDDARLVLENVRGAHLAGALCANHAEVTAIDRRGAVVRDALGDVERLVRARVVVNAGGPWADQVERRAGVRDGLRLQLTKGIHLVVPHARLPLRQVVVMAARDKRSVFAVPRDAVTYLGTTDTLADAAALNPSIGRDDVDYLLDAANRTFAGPPLAERDIIGAWAGLRPLLYQEGKTPSEISRRDEVRVDPSTGLVSIAGGKLTAYRTMAERVVD